jgi:transcriptional regulator with GAF, ATPase, and Fis domain
MIPIYERQEMIGTGKGLRKVCQLVSQVKEADTTVLIQGETGTGKELVARAIHSASPRSDKRMVKLNCAALPAELIESELFGHEKGSFTDARERRIGKFELAHKSTLFLDEIGELAPPLQVKLLRVLQEKEIERVGGKETIFVDVRIIAATNRDLYREMQAGRFRSDLYYRLNVFPISLPPLRERKEDIPLLVMHFLDIFVQKMSKSITTVSPDAMRMMMKYDWPGNIRELEHVMERTVILTSGPIIEEIYLPIISESRNEFEQLDHSRIKSLEELERDHIVSILRMSEGRVRGPGGAAELLQLPPTTLQSKIKKFGIR